MGDIINWVHVLTPIIGIGVGWWLRLKRESLLAIENRLHSERSKIYGELLKPYAQILSDLSPQNQKNAIKKLRSTEYRKTAIEFTLFGSDEVVRAFNKFMQHIFTTEKEDQNVGEVIQLWGKFLLEIRKSVGNKETELSEYEMLESMITDINKYRDA